MDVEFQSHSPRRRRRHRRRAGLLAWLLGCGLLLLLLLLQKPLGLAAAWLQLALLVWLRRGGPVALQQRGGQGSQRWWPGRGAATKGRPRPRGGPPPGARGGGGRGLGAADRRRRAAHAGDAELNEWPQDAARAREAAHSSSHQWQA